MQKARGSFGKRRRFFVISLICVMIRIFVGYLLGQYALQANNRLRPLTKLRSMS